MADRNYRHGRYDRDHPRNHRSNQPQQFESERSWQAGEEHGYRQMDDDIRDDDGRFNVARGGYGRGTSDSYDRWSGENTGRSGSGRDPRSGYGRPADQGYSASGSFESFTSNDYGGRDFSRSPYGNIGRPYTGFGMGVPGYGVDGSSRSYGTRFDPDESRGWFERAGDEIASWFGDEDAARRREQDHSGRGPSGYTRSDDRILEDVSDSITRDWRVDGTNVQVTVQSGEVTLDGTVGSRLQKRRAEDLADDVSGVKHVQNNLRVHEESAWDRNNTGSTAAGRDKS